MNEIRMLDQETINQIAAGEVIERPASIVKELVENAIDAGASQIHVEIRDGGISYIRVTDNGSGIDPSQIRTAFLRHSTSKIQSAADLMNIGSLGFRGEALASIAAVSRVEVLTRIPSRMTGIRYVIEGGEEKKMEEIACPAGTTFRVENLFFNTPVRKKFLKSATTEASQVSDYISRMVMGHPEISFRFVKNGKEPAIHSPGNNQLKNGIYAVYGRDILSQMIPVRAEGAIAINGFISLPQQTRANRTYENYYLNGRYIRSRIIERAIDDAYRDYVVPGTYPVLVLDIRMDPQDLDVNVHPTKMEVRFTKEREVSDAVFTCVYDALRKHDLTARMQGMAKVQAEVSPEAAAIPQSPLGAVPTSEPEPAAAPVQTNNHRYEQGDLFTPEPVMMREPVAPYGEVLHPESQGVREAVPVADVANTAASDRPDLSLMHLVGQVFRTYWIAETPDTIYMIDQHAAHERVLYDRLKEKLSTGMLDAQILLEPLIVTLSPHDYRRVLENQNVFDRLGYSIASFGENSVIIREVPYIFNGTLGQDDFQTMVDLLEEGGRRVDQQILIDRMAMISCKAAVKGNDAITFQEMQSLLEQLLSSSNPFNCPHGRPTMLTMTKQEVEHRFGRS